MPRTLHGEAPVADVVVLENAHLRAEVAPAPGASILSLDAVAGSAPVPILRRTPLDSLRPTDRAMFLMIPWCNRVSGDGLVWNGRAYPLPRLVPDQALPLHGTALHQRFALSSVGPDQVTARLRDARTPPFDYEATVTYRLDGPRFAADLMVRHVGPSPAPYGIGFHPWFARAPHDVLRFRAREWLEEDEQRLPIARRPITGSPLEFEAGRTLPDALINATTLGWDGSATLARSDGLVVAMEAEGATARQLHVFSRGRDCGFVCLEPVSHTVDCTHRPLAPDAMMRALSTGDTLSARLSILVATRAGDRSAGP